MQLFRRNRDRDASEIGAAVAQQASDTANKAGRMMEQGLEQASRAMATASERSAEMAESASESIEDLRSTIESSVRAQPIMALAIAAIAGIAVGAMFRTGSTDSK